MFKNFLRTLTLLTFFISTGNVMGSAPGVDAWKDDAGQPAPAGVRRAAENLWTAVKEEGKAAFDAGWGIKKKTSSTCHRVSAALCTIGISECQIACAELDTFVHDTGMFGKDWHEHDTKEVKAIYDQKHKQVTEALRSFKDAVNLSVSRPEQYSGDAHICQFGPWIVDNRNNTRDCGVIWFVSASRDLNDILRLVRAFVRAHGGWASKGVPPRTTAPTSDPSQTYDGWASKRVPPHTTVPTSDASQTYSSDPRQPLLENKEKDYS